MLNLLPYGKFDVLTMQIRHNVNTTLDLVYTVPDPVWSRSNQIEYFQDEFGSYTYDNITKFNNN